MAILVFNRFPKSKIDYAEWFAELDEELFMFTTERVIDEFDEFAVRKAFDVFYKDGRVEVEAVKLHQERPFRAIIALEETEILRAARLRERLGLYGQHTASAKAFRNKVVMKQTARDGGIPVPAFQALSGPLDVYDFVQEHGLPVVIKPQEGMSSMNTAILHSEEELDAWLKTGTYRDMMIESFVGGDIYHVDGIIAEGEVRFICASAYVNTCIAFTESKGFGSVVLSADNPLGQRLIAFVRDLLHVLPSPMASTFHCEVFHTPDDRLVLCEIASRTAGGKSLDLFQCIFGVNFDRYAARAAVGLIDPLPDSIYNTERAGVFYIPPKIGVLKSMPEEVPFAWCESYEKIGEIGKTYNGPQYSTDSYAIVAVRGENDGVVTERLKELIEYVETHTVWEK